MSNQDDILPQRRLRVMQIIAGMILLSVLLFLAVALHIVFVRTNGGGLAPARDLSLVSIVAVVVFAMQAPLAFLLPSFRTRTALRRIASGTWPLPPGANAAAFSTDASKLLTVRQTTMIFGLALLNGTAFFGCIAYLLEARPFVLGVVLVADMLMLVNFPTEGRVRAWLGRQVDQLAELRQLGPPAGEVTVELRRRSKSVSVFSDWSFCLAAIGTGLGTLFLVLQTLWPPGHGPRVDLWVLGICLAGLVAVLVWRIVIIRLVNREGVTVEGEVISGGTSVVYVKYPFEGKEVRTRFSWWSWDDFPQKGDRLPLVIDPRKPSRCYVLRRDGP